MGRPPCCEESGVKKGPWTPEEDEKLFNYISKHGSGNWKSVPKHAGLNRCGKSCRLRWTNYLRPDIKRGKFTEQDEQLIINLHSVLGNKWSKIATHLPGRTDNEIKNFWNTNLRKKLLQMGIDPETHKPRTDFNHLLNLVQLLGRPNNNNLMMSHAGLVGLLQQPDLSNQLAQIQLLQNLLQLMNANSSLVNNMQSNVLPFFGNHSLINNPMMEAADTNGISPSESAHDISESWTELEGASSEQVLGVNNSISRTTSRDISEAESLLPMFDSTTFHQMEISPIADEVRSTKSTSSAVFDSDWEKYLEDPDTSDDSFWKELLNLPSPSAWPIS